jgi:hypothetical protein
MLDTTPANPEEEPVEPPKFRAIGSNEQFGPQFARRKDLPNPEVFLRNLTQRAVEVLAGSRDLSQIARWVTDDVFHSIQYQVTARAITAGLRTREAKKRRARRFQLSSVRFTAPREGIIEGCVLVSAGQNIRVAAVRLEGFDRRWRASSFTLL